MTPKCLACVTTWIVVPFTELERAMLEEDHDLGGKVRISFLDCICFEVTVIHLRSAVMHAVVFIGVKLNKKYGLAI